MGSAVSFHKLLLQYMLSNLKVCLGSLGAIKHVVHHAASGINLNILPCA